METPSGSSFTHRRRRASHATRLLVLIAALALASLWLAVRRPVARDTIAPVDTGYRVPINHAEHHELMLLPGIGPTLADNIIAHRQEHGPFTETAQLRDVHRIGVVTAERMKPWITFETQRTQPQ